LIGELAGNGATVLVTTHHLEEAEHCDRIAIIHAGKLAAMGTPSELKAPLTSSAHTNPSIEDVFIDVVERHA
jgi:ABC-2 type transport system ATP-binding protein